jgi:hypothetical protein
VRHESPHYTPATTTDLLVGDEAKPICENCSSKSLLCRYGTAITFVGSKDHRRQQSLRSQTYKNIQFVTEAPFANATNPSSGLAQTTTEPPSKQTRQRQQQEPGASTTNRSPTEDFSHPHSISIPGIPLEPLLETDGTFRQDDISPYGSAESVGASGGPLRDNLAVRGATRCGPTSFTSTNSPRSPNSPELCRGGFGAESTPDSESHLDRQSANYETELLKQYRYHIATILDLGTGSLYFGVQALVRSKSSKSVYYAILALASCQRSQTNASTRSEDHASSLVYATYAEKSFDISVYEDQVLTSILLAWRIMLVTSPRLWHEHVTPLFRQYGGLEESLPMELRQIIARLSLSAALIAAPEAWDLSYLGHSIFTPRRKGSVQQQLQESFSLLESALTISHSAGQRPMLVNSTGFSAWKSHWRDVQNWHVARIEEMQQVFELTEIGAAEQRAAGQLDFPVIVFSNASATVANIVHHATALLLLQQKPRLVRAAAEDGSSISPMWHALRVLGIATTASEEGIWDSLVASTVIYAARKLSHEKQLSIVTDVLRKGSRITGMVFEEEIEKLHQGYSISID